MRLQSAHREVARKLRSLSVRLHCSCPLHGVSISQSALPSTAVQILGFESIERMQAEVVVVADEEQVGLLCHCFGAEL